MFTTIYRPKKYKNFIGNKQIIQLFIAWLLDWDTINNKKKCALIYGLCGIGKSLLVELILKKLDYNIVNLEVDENRDKEFVTTNIKPLIHTLKTFNGQNNALVVSDIDSGNDYGFISTIIECIKETKIPIICICDNKYDQNIKPVLSYCEEFKMVKPSYQEVYSLMYNVVINEKIRIKESQIKSLYEQSNGDIRFMLNTLQFGGYNNQNCIKNIQSLNIFETTGKLLSIDETLENKYETYWLSNDLHTLMIQENYINNTIGNNIVKRLENTSYAADALTDVDLFEKYVNMTNWEFEPHVAINTLNACSKCNKKAMVKFPQFLGRTSTINKNKKINKMYDYKSLEYDNIYDGKNAQTNTPTGAVKPPKPEKTRKYTKTTVTNNVDKNKKPRGRPKKT